MVEVMAIIVIISCGNSSSGSNIIISLSFTIQHKSEQNRSNDQLNQCESGAT